MKYKFHKSDGTVFELEAQWPPKPHIILVDPTLGRRLYRAQKWADPAIQNEWFEYHEVKEGT